MTRPRVPVQWDVDWPIPFGPGPERLLLAVGVFVWIVFAGRLLVVPALVRIVGVRNPDNPTLNQAVERYARLGVLVAGVALAMWAGGYGYVLAGSAVVVAAVTLAIGVAGQEVIGNLVSGVFLVLDPEFNVDDWITWEDGEGIVETIRFRVTRVRTPDNEIITVPNTTLATTAVRRPYSRDRFRLVIGVDVASDEDLGAVIAAIREELATVEAVVDDPAPRVAVEAFASDAITLAASGWIDQPTHGEVVAVRSACVRRIQERLLAEGVDFSPPAQQRLSGAVEVERPDRSD